MIDLELRGQVAIACGWTDLVNRRVRTGDSLYGTHPNLNHAYPVTQYDFSVDAIAAELTKRKWGWGLQTLGEFDPTGLVYEVASYEASSASFELVP
jgi:hypothetical protein